MSREKHIADSFHFKQTARKLVLYSPFIFAIREVVGIFRTLLQVFLPFVSL